MQPRHEQRTSTFNERPQASSGSSDQQRSYGRTAATVGGALLAIYGLTRGSPQGLGMAAAGGAILYRALNGNWPIPEAVSNALPDITDGKVIASVTVMRPVDELYSFWRNFSNLPHFMKHLKSVEVIDDKYSRWTATGPANTDITWEAVITNETPGKTISWKSTEGAMVTNEGTVSFEQAPGDRGTIVRVAIHYAPPAGAVGMTIARLFGEEPSQQVVGDLRRFRSMMEAGEIPTVAGQPSGSRSFASKLMQPEPTKVQERAVGS